MATEKRNRDMYPPAAFLRSMDRRKGRGTEDIRKMLRSSKPQRPTNILESREYNRFLNSLTVLFFFHNILQRAARSIQTQDCLQRIYKYAGKRY